MLTRRVQATSERTIESSEGLSNVRGALSGMQSERTGRRSRVAPFASARGANSFVTQRRSQIHSSGLSECSCSTEFLSLPLTGGLRASRPGDGPSHSQFKTIGAQAWPKLPILIHHTSQSDRLSRCLGLLLREPADVRTAAAQGRDEGEMSALIAQQRMCCIPLRESGLITSLTRTDFDQGWTRSAKYARTRHNISHSGHGQTGGT